MSGSNTRSIVFSRPVLDFADVAWFPAAFPLKYALFNITAGFAIIALNAPYYQFLILCVYDTRVEANLRIPSHPTWLRRLPLFKCLRQKTKDDALPAKPTEECSCVTPIATNDDELSAIKLLEAALDSIGQSSLLPLFVDSGWDDLDALAGLQEHHVAQIAKLKLGHIARFRRCLWCQLEGRVDAKKAS